MMVYYVQLSEPRWSFAIESEIPLIYVDVHLSPTPRPRGAP